MKTLVIHPDDRSTDFLRPIYRRTKCTLVTNDYSRLIEQIKSHDRIIMLGHGSSEGLLDLQGGFAIDYRHASLLKEKKENFYIWCHANEYAEKYNLPGFYTGMFISELLEAYSYGIEATQEEIDYSNNLFAENMGRIANTGKQLWYDIKRAYYSYTCPVIQYNSERLRYKYLPAEIEEMHQR